MAKRGFYATHLAFEEKLNRMGMALLKESVQDLAEEANTPIAQGGKMPVDTGNLRNSFLASKTGMPNSSSAPLAFVLVSWKPGETVWMGWTAAYALRQEFGFYGPDSLGREYSQPGKAFMRSSVQNWPHIVDNAAARVMRSAAGKPL